MSAKFRILSSNDHGDDHDIEIDLEATAQTVPSTTPRGLAGRGEPTPQVKDLAPLCSRHDGGPGSHGEHIDPPPK